MKRAAIVMVAAVTIAASSILPASASESTWTYGAVKKTSYESFDYSDGVNTVYIVDRENWYVGDKPFQESVDETYKAYWTYIPCVASYPVEYTTQIAQNVSHITSDEGTVVRRYMTYLDCASFVSSTGQLMSEMKLTLTLNYADYSESQVLETITFTQGVDFQETCIYLGAYVANGDATLVGTTGQLIFVFQIDNGFKFVNFSTPYYTDIYMGSDSSYEFYVMGFTTGQPTYNSYNDEFQGIYGALFNYLHGSDNFNSWVRDFYATADDKMLEAVSEILGVMTQPSDVPAPAPQAPSQEIQDTISNVTNDHGGVGGSFDSYFSQATSALDDLTAKVVDTADFLTLNSIFSWTVMQILELPKFVVIVDALVFAFLLWVLGLNLASIFKRPDNQRGDHNARDN